MALSVMSLVRAIMVAVEAKMKREEMAILWPVNSARRRQLSSRAAAA